MEHIPLRPDPALRKVSWQGGAYSVIIPRAMVVELGIQKGDYLAFTFVRDGILALQTVDLTQRPDLRGFVDDEVGEK